MRKCKRKKRRVIGIWANFPLGESGFVLNGNGFQSQFSKLIRFECNCVHLICESSKYLGQEVDQPQNS